MCYSGYGHSIWYTSKVCDSCTGILMKRLLVKLTSFQPSSQMLLRTQLRGIMLACPPIHCRSCNTRVYPFGNARQTCRLASIAKIFIDAAGRYALNRSLPAEMNSSSSRNTAMRQQHSQLCSEALSHTMAVALQLNMALSNVSGGRQ